MKSDSQFHLQIDSELWSYFSQKAIFSYKNLYDPDLFVQILHKLKAIEKKKKK